MSLKLLTVEFDGSNFFGRAFHDKLRDLDPYVTDLDMEKIMLPSSSLRAYYPDDPHPAIIKRKLTETEEKAHLIFREVFDEHPYESVKARFKFIGSYSSDRFTKVKEFYKSLVEKKCNDVGCSYDDLFNEKLLYDCIVRETENADERVKRFKRKAFINKWDYFITVTYDSKKFSSEKDFEKSLRTTFMNLDNRYNFKVIGVFERGADNNRLHFHGLCSFKKMPGFLFDTKDFSLKHQKIHRHQTSSYFLDRYGKNEFDPITLENNERDYKKLVDYLVKYCSKYETHFFYSRGVRSFKAFFYDSKKRGLIICGDSILYRGRHYYFDDLLSIDDVNFVPMTT